MTPIDDDTRREIFALDAKGASQRQIATAVNVAQSTVCNVLKTKPHTRQGARVHLEVENGTVVVASDAHYWPGDSTTAHRGLLTMCQLRNPQVVIMNGDAFDGSRISRHGMIGWERKPSVFSELQAVSERMAEIKLNTSMGTKLVWTLGNHDMRFETRLAAVAPEYEGIQGFHLKDHFPDRKSVV